MKKWLLTAVLFLGTVCQSGAQEKGNPAYVGALKNLMEISGGYKSYDVAMDQMVDMVKRMQPGISEEQWNVLLTELKGNAMNELIELIAPVYEKYLALEDLKALTAFYETPVGKKYSAAMPLITTDVMKVSQQWGMGLAKKLQDTVKDQADTEAEAK